MIKTRLKQLRYANLDRIVSIKKLSEMTDLSRAYLTDMERGRLATLDVERFQKVCEKLGCTMSDLIVYDALEKEQELAN